MPKLLTPKEIANKLSIPVRSAYRIIREKKIRSFRVGRLIRVLEGDFEAYIASELSEVSHDKS